MDIIRHQNEQGKVNKKISYIISIMIIQIYFINLQLYMAMSTGTFITFSGIINTNLYKYLGKIEQTSFRKQNFVNKSLLYFCKLREKCEKSEFDLKFERIKIIPISTY